MPYVAMRGSAALNGVSRLHGDVSRQIFQLVFPRWPTAEVPIGHVTKDIHTPSWGRPRSTGCGQSDAENSDGGTRHRPWSATIACASDAELWSMRGIAR